MGEPNVRSNRAKVCLFVDNAYVYTALTTIGGLRLDYKRLKNWLSAGRETAIARYYSPEIRNDNSERRSYYEVLRRAGYEVVTFQNSRSSEKNAAFDAIATGVVRQAMVWDICELLHLGYYNAFVLLTGSGTFTETVSRIRRRGVDAELAFFDSICDNSLKARASSARSINLGAVSLEGRLGSGMRDREKSGNDGSLERGVRRSELVGLQFEIA